MSGLKKVTVNTKGQRGATAVEFALLLPFFFTVLYGGITYGLVYFLQQRINFAAQEGVRAAIAFDPASPGYATAVVTTATTAATTTFTGNGTLSLPAALTTTSTTINAGTQIQVTVVYNLATEPKLFPTITLPFGIGDVPSLPATLISTAVGRLS